MNNFVSRAKAIQFIQEIAKSPMAFDTLEISLRSLPSEELASELLNCGIIPEMYGHDSSEEKLWAKYCDVLLAQAFNSLNISAEVLRARGNSADVYGRTQEYTIVGDAKAFRLSRTAKNQKDFKVNALDDWRKTNTFACLVAPLYQFPTMRSQIYLQAEAKNVTLLSYVHLRFLLDYAGTTSLKPLWETPKSLPPSQSSIVYWDAIDSQIIELTGQNLGLLKDYKQIEIEHTKQLGQEGITYWEAIIEDYKSFTKEEAINALIKSQKIDEKIRTIKRMISKDMPV
jgi:type II restriction enzyme